MVTLARSGTLAAVALALLALSGGNALAATITVNSSGDTPDALAGDGTCGAIGVPNSCTLRAAISEANANADTSNVISMTGISGPIALTTGLPSITKAVAINGPTARITVNGADNASAFRFICTTAPCPSGGNYSISNVIVTNSKAINTSEGSGGGGIYFGAIGTVNFTLTNVDVTSSEATAGPGGGIAAVLVSNGSTLTMSNVKIGATGSVGPDSNGNKSTGDGAGLYVRFDGSGSGTLTLENSVVVNNVTSAGNGGGVAVLRGRLNIFESTLSGNTATVGKGGGLYLGKTGAVGGSARIENVTISGNTAVSGGGIGAATDNPAGSWMTNATVTGNTGGGIAVATNPATTFPGNSVSFPFASNIVAGNTGNECAAAFGHAATIFAGYNLTDEAEAGNSCGFTTANHDRFGTTAQTLGLGALANNPSAPQTHALLAGSLAIDGGNPDSDTGSDQRGATTQDGGADGTPGDGTPVRDIGAYEFGGYGLVQFTLADYEVNEDYGPALVTIKRYGTGTATTTTPTVEFTSAADTAGEGTCGDGGVDYTDANPASFTFTLSGTTQFEQTASFTICSDTTADEPDETLTIALAEPGTDTAGYDLGPVASGTVTIHDVENGSFTFDNTTAHSANEGSAAAPGSITLTVKRTSGSDGAVRVNYTTVTGASCSPACTATSDTDYTAATSFVDFADGQTSATITIDFIGDAAFEGNETFRVNLTGASCLGLAAGQQCDARLVGTGSDPGRFAGVTISNDDASVAGLLQFEFESYTANEETGTLTVKVKRVGGSDGAVSVDVAANDGTAEAGTDYNVTSPVGGTLNWTAGDSADKTVTVTLVNDPLKESNKDFELVLSNAQLGGTPDPTLLGDPNEAAVTLVSGEQPAFQFNPDAYSLSEGNTNITLTVTWDSFTGQDVAVPYFTVDGTAVSPVDYTGIPQGTPGTITATAGGPTSATFTVAIKNDTAAEGNEVFTANLGTPTGGGTLGPDTPATVAIIDPSGARFTAASFTRADEQNGATITATVERFGDVSQPFTVDFEISECATAGCATQGDDFYRLAGSTGTLSWGADQGGTRTFTVNVQSDTLIEGDETFALALSNPQVGPGPTTSEGALGLAAATGIIPDDDYRFEIVEVSPLAVGESAGNATVSVRRFGSTLGAASVNYATANGTATAGSDYTAQASPPALSWAGGEGGIKTVTVPVTTDAIDELDETFTVALSSPSNNVVGEATPITGSPLTLSITDDDTSVASIVATASATEASNVTFGVTLSNASDRDVVVTYNTADGTAAAGADFTGVTNGTITFTAGETSKNIVIATLGDARNEADETFTVGLASATNGGQISGSAGTGTGTIVDDDPVPTLSIADALVTEANTTDTTLTFVVSLSSASGRTVTVNYATADGTATAPADYTAVSSTMLTFDPGDISKNVVVTVKSDAVDELAETMTASLSAAVNATVADGSATGTIDDAADDVTPTVSVSSPTVTEGNAGTVNLVFTVSQTGLSSRNVTFNYVFAAVTATSGTDYTVAPASGTAMIAAGQLSTTFTVAVNGDAVDETNETLTLTLSNLANANAGTLVGTGTITDDDAAPTVTLSTSAPTLVETGGTATVTATLSAASAQAVTVTLGFTGTATNATDYTVSTASITINPGATSGAATLTGVGDGSNEPDETVIVDITAVTNGTESGTQTQTVTITDDDSGGGGGSWSLLSLWLLLPAVVRRRRLAA